ncbi:hypothetical protein [Leptospira santarosai]|uniref:hypothetical protein n=1 Tax=Leptospira santarosai TaxID=28183 RepID=UPI0002F6FDE7|nr:hypothetical protein [Leptospira santarosai]MDI7190879.1 hypothetical protein [Leptospira santarosai]
MNNTKTKQIKKFSFAYNLLDTDPVRAIQMLSDLGWTVDEWELIDGSWSKK